jgi:DNA polymerase-1
VENELGIKPELIPHLKALSGDASDNIPGVKGIGEKKALQYLEKYASIQGMLSHEAMKDMVKSKVAVKIIDNFPDVVVY